MKKIIISLFSLFMILATVTAQDVDKAVKNAKKSMNKYAVATDGKDELLMEAKAEIDVASSGMKSGDEKDALKVWELKGQIYNELALMDAKNKLIDPTYSPKVPYAALDAYNAYKELLKGAQKKYQVTDAVDGLVLSSTNLSNMGRWLYGDKDFKGAYQAFNAISEARILAKQNDNNDILAEEEAYNEHLFMTGLSAYQAEDFENAERLYEELKKSNYQEPAIYEVLYAIKESKGDGSALAILEEGRSKYPEDEGLRIKEINYYLKENKLDALVDKLKVAIEKTPDNISLQLTLGYVYDNLFQREQEAGNDSVSEEYFNNALNYYNQALNKEPQNHSAIYSIGALHYNKAAMMTKELVVLEGDYSKAGLAKYDIKKQEVFSRFDVALPYFIKAEKLDPNDIGTITALKEIYAKKDQLDLYNEFKSRLDKIQNGETVERSYFADNK